MKRRKIRLDEFKKLYPDPRDILFRDFGYRKDLTYNLKPYHDTFLLSQRRQGKNEIKKL